MIESIKNNPVRIYAIATAVLAVVAFYVPSIPAALFLGLVAAVIGYGGEVTRNQVTPKRNPQDDEGTTLVPVTTVLSKRADTDTGPVAK